MIIDTHMHLEGNDTEKRSIINESILKGIDYLFLTGYDQKVNLEVIEIVNSNEKVYGVIGIGPGEADNYHLENLVELEKQINNNKIIAIGEIGLDYYWQKDNKEKQTKLFTKQLELAQKLKKPVVIHSRDAIQDTYDILKEYKVKGALHCFSGSLEMAKEFIKLGFYLGIGGVVTFKNAKEIKNVVKEIPLEKIILETDSPYLAPQSHRGEINYPWYIKEIVAEIANIKGISEEQVKETTSKNVIALFDLKK